MADPMRMIYWRPEINSYLPPIDDACELICSELERHVQQSFVMGVEESLYKIDGALQTRYGSWIPAGFSRWILAKSPVHEVDQILPAVEKVFECLRDARTRVDQVLRRYYERHGARGSENLAFGEIVKATMIAMVHDVLLNESCDDRWFGYLEIETPWYLESLGCPETDSEVGEIADRHFRSWIEPTEDAIQRFADEVAALAVRRAFQEKYGRDG